MVWTSDDDLLNQLGYVVSDKEQFMVNKVNLRDTHTAEGDDKLDAILEANGDVKIVGQDLGMMVEEFWGEGLLEYEYVITIQSKDVSSLSEALGAKQDVLISLQEYYSNPEAQGIKSLLKQHDIPYKFWSRIGD